MKYEGALLAAHRIGDAKPGNTVTILSAVRPIDAWCTTVAATILARFRAIQNVVTARFGTTLTIGHTNANWTIVLTRTIHGECARRTLGSAAVHVDFFSVSNVISTRSRSAHPVAQTNTGTALGVVFAALSIVATRTE